MFSACHLIFARANRCVSGRGARWKERPWGCCWWGDVRENGGREVLRGRRRAPRQTSSTALGAGAAGIPECACASSEIHAFPYPGCLGGGPGPRALLDLQFGSARLGRTRRRVLPWARGAPKSRSARALPVRFTRSRSQGVWGVAPVPGRYSTSSFARLGWAAPNVEYCPGRGTHRNRLLWDRRI